MLREIQQVLRLIMLMKKQRLCQGSNTGGLLVLLWTETGAAIQRLNCTVAAAGPWCAEIEMTTLQHVLRDLRESMLPSMWSCPEPDPEELSAFTDLYGLHRLLLSFQMKDAGHYTSEWQAHLEAFLYSFSLVNAGINIHLKFKFDQQTSQQEFRVKMKRKLAQSEQPSLVLDVTCATQPPLCVKKGCWCQGGHPVLGGKLPLSIPPQAMDQGLFGDLTVQFATLLRPCLLQYPNVATELTHIHVLVYSPSNLPVPGPSGFFQTLPVGLDCQELGLDGLYCSSSKDLQHISGTVYTVKQENWENPKKESSLQMQQSLLLFLFLQHSDPFTTQLTDIVATEILMEHHLQDILEHNKQDITAALQTELRDALKAQNRRKKNQEKLQSAAEVILSSSISIVSCSSNLDFRNACLDRMKVHDTHELSASLQESLWRVTSWKFVPRSKCYSAQMEGHPESDDPTRTEL